jgi:hypothetical protein
VIAFRKINPNDCVWIPFGFEPSFTKTVPKPYVIGASGVTSSEKQIPRNC